MRVGIDGKVLSPHAAGIGRYGANLVRQLIRLGDPEVEYVVFSAPQTSREILEGLRGGWTEVRLPARSSLVRAALSLPRGIRQQRLDLFHGLDHVGIPLYSGETRCVVTVHDIMPLQYPEWFSRKHRWVVRVVLSGLLARARLVIVPSESVRGDILERGLVAPERISVIPEGRDERFHAESDPVRSAEVRDRYDLPDDYILFVGTLDPRKNLDTLLHALAVPGSELPPLVIAGAPGRGTATIRERIAELHLNGRVQLTGFVDDDDLPELYRQATVFAFPSYCEGFGLPLLEAMACGTPVVASDRSAMPEVAGDAALYVDPGSAEALSDAIRRLAEDSRLREQLGEAGVRRAAGFTWELAARRTLAAYREVVD